LTNTKLYAIVKTPIQDIGCILKNSDIHYHITDRYDFVCLCVLLHSFGCAFFYLCSLIFL